jgi:hypothetical protein
VGRLHSECGQLHLETGPTFLTEADLVSREELYELVWSTPMTKVAEKFKVSGSYMARVCSILRVPRPEQGYWSKLAFGKAPERTQLPEAQPGDQLSWSQDGELQLPPQPRLATPPSPSRPRLRHPVTGTHGLIRDAKEHFDAGLKVDEGKHLRPYKRLLVDVTASRAGLEQALAFANDLFNALESKGHRVVISSQPERFPSQIVQPAIQPAKYSPDYELSRTYRDLAVLPILVSC